MQVQEGVSAMMRANSITIMYEQGIDGMKHCIIQAIGGTAPTIGGHKYFYLVERILSLLQL